MQRVGTDELTKQDKDILLSYGRSEFIQKHGHPPEILNFNYDDIAETVKNVAEAMPRIIKEVYEAFGRLFKGLSESFYSASDNIKENDNGEKTKELPEAEIQKQEGDR